jgi:quinoprotein dehydrogenase-associated probable ABC transporter substrate-binding protein
MTSLRDGMATHVRRGLLVAAGVAALLFSIACPSRPPTPRVLRVCADPNNLPFSKFDGSGFENRIAELLAADRHATLEYTWWAQRRGFVRNTLKAGACDVLIGVPRQFDLARTTRPYYRSGYVFLSRRDRGLALESFDDPRLRHLRIGVQMIGDDFNNSPPAHALSNRGIIRNVVGYSVYGDYSRPSPLSEIVDAVDRGEVDAAVVWGPAAGYFARESKAGLALRAVSPQRDSASLPFAFDISMGVRRDDAALCDELDDFIVRRRADIDSILNSYGVPRVES